MKRCKKCGEEKALDEFYKNPGAKDRRRPECKACTAARRKRWYQQNRGREIARVRRWQRENEAHYRRQQAQYRSRVARNDRAGHLRRKFGLAEAEFVSLAALQGGACAICGDPPAEGKHLHIDHDPETGVIRGLLCVRCNNGLGQFKERTELLLTAADYVEADGFGSRAVSLRARARARAFELKRGAA